MPAKAAEQTTEDTKRVPLIVRTKCVRLNRAGVQSRLVLDKLSLTLDKSFLGRFQLLERGGRVDVLLAENRNARVDIVADRLDRFLVIDEPSHLFGREACRTALEKRAGSYLCGHDISSSGICLAVRLASRSANTCSFPRTSFDRRLKTSMSDACFSAAAIRSVMVLRRIW